MKQIMRALRLVAVSCTDVNPDGSPRWLRLASIVATLNQVVGAVYLERVLQADKADNADNASASQDHDEKKQTSHQHPPSAQIFPARTVFSCLSLVVVMRTMKMMSWPTETCSWRFLKSLSGHQNCKHVWMAETRGFLKMGDPKMDGLQWNILLK